MADDPSPVVVGVDGSDPSRVAMRWAADEAVRLGRPLRIVHAVGPGAWDVPFPPAPTMMECLHEAGGQILEQAITEVRRWRPELRVTTVLTAEPPSVALRDQAGEAHEIVVGNRGRGGFAGLLLGSVSLHVVGYASCPVVVVRGGPPGGREIVAGIDLSEHSGTALRYAFDAAAVRDAPLRVVHAWCPPEGPYAVLEVGELAEAAARETHAVVAPWRDRYPQVPVREDHPRDNPVGALVTASAQAELVVVVARGHSGLRLGSVSHGLVHHAHCPVAVLPPA